MSSFFREIAKQRYLDIILVCVFFYFYTVGKVIGRERFYLYTFFVIILLAIYRFIKAPYLLKRFRSYYKWQVLMLFFFFIAYLYTANPKVTFQNYIVFFFILIKITSVAILCRDFQGIKMLMKGLAFTGLLVFLTLYSTGTLFVANRLGEDVTGNANSFAMVIAVFGTGAIWGALNSDNIWWRIGYIAVAVVILFMILLSGGRKYVLYLSVFLYLSLLMTSKRKNIGSIIAGSILVCVLIVLLFYAIMNVDILYDSIGYRFDGMLNNEAVGQDDQKGLMLRGIKLFLQRPLFGWGLNAYKYVSGTGIYSHSNYVELLANHGIFVSILYYSQHFACLRKMMRNISHPSEQIKLFFPLLVSILVLDVFCVTYNQSAFIPLFIMVISGYCTEKTVTVK